MGIIIIKKLLIGIILISSVSYINTPLKNFNKSKECLEVIGIAIGENNEAIDGIGAKLFKKNEEMEWVEITNVPYHYHNFSFTLDVNEYYTIEISKSGFVKRSVVISTILPTDVSVKPLFSFGFEVILFKEKKGIDDYYLDFPVALISYNKKSEVFENNHTYTKHIKTKVKESEQKVKVKKILKK